MTSPVANSGAAASASLAARLAAACGGERHERAATLAAELLGAGAPSDAPESAGVLDAAQQCRVVALIQQDKFQQALDALEGLEGAYVLERAYCLYRLGDNAKALAALGKAQGAAEDKLRAQVLYRLGRSAEALAALRQHVRAAAGQPDAAELATNALACAAAAAAEGAAAEGEAHAEGGAALLAGAGVEPRDSFELAYNAACCLLAAGALNRAEEMLGLALKVGRAALELQDCAEEEIAEELAPAEVQLAFVQQITGRGDEASAAYEQALDGGRADAATAAVAAVNLAAARGKHGLFDSLKRLAQLFGAKGAAKGAGATYDADAIAPALDARLADPQRRALLRTRAVLQALSGKGEPASRAAAAFASRFPGDAAAVTLAATRPGADAGAADSALLAFASATGRAARDVAAAHAARAELALRGGRLGAAADALEAIAAATGHTPPVVATLLDIYGRMGDEQRSAATLDRALASGGAGGDAALPAELLRGAAERRQAEGRHAEAAALWARCEGRAGEADAALAQLARAHSVECYAAIGELERAEAAAAELPPVPGADKLSAEALLATPLPGSRGDARAKAQAKATAGDGTAAGQGVATIATGGAATGGADGTDREGSEGADAARRKRHGPSARRKERKRLKRLPKGYDPANPPPPPDPERWLPKRERASYRRKGKKKDALKGGQGAVTADKMAKLDAMQTVADAGAASAPNRGTGKKGRKTKGRR